MQIEELYDLISWITAEIVDKQLVQKYQQLHKILQQNAQPNQQKQPFEQQKEALISALTEVPLHDLSLGQIEILTTIGIADNVGVNGVELVEDTLFKNSLDIATAVQRIQQSVQEINQGIQWSQQERELLSKIINTEEVLEIGEQVLLRVHFTREAHLSNLTELKDWGKAWWEIGRGIGMAHGEAPENISVVGASKGSIIVSLLSAYAIAKTASGIIMEALKVIEKVYDIKKKAQEVKALELANSDAEKSLEEAAETEKQNGVENIINHTIDEIGLDRNSEGDKVNELSSAVRKLVDFVEKGGEVDFVLPDEEEEPGEDEQNENIQERENLRVMFKEVRRLEKKVHQLEHKQP
jgi:hypothetical protein